MNKIELALLLAFMFYQRFKSEEEEEADSIQEVEKLRPDPSQSLSEYFNYSSDLLKQAGGTDSAAEVSIMGRILLQIIITKLIIGLNDLILQTRLAGYSCGTDLQVVPFRKINTSFGIAKTAPSPSHPGFRLLTPYLGYYVRGQCGFGEVLSPSSMYIIGYLRRVEVPE